jgi:fructosamine-3-kinase
VTLDRTLEHRECKTKWLLEGQVKVAAGNPEQTVIRVFHYCANGIELPQLTTSITVTNTVNVFSSRLRSYLATVTLSQAFADYPCVNESRVMATETPQLFSLPYVISGGDQIRGFTIRWREVFHKQRVLFLVINYIKSGRS